MDKLMNAANAGNNEKRLKDGEYAFYVINKSEDGNTFKLVFMGDSPFDKNTKNVRLDYFDYYSKITNNLDISDKSEHKENHKPDILLNGLYEYEMPGYCVVLNGIIYPKRFYSTKKFEEKRVMMLSTLQEVIMEDMSSYRLPKSSNSEKAGSLNWFMNKYIDRGEGNTILTARIFKGVLIDFEWERGVQTYHNFLDRLQYLTENIGWTTEEMLNRLGM